MEHGYIYALTTKDFERSIKVGFTFSPLERFFAYVTCFRYPVQLLALWKITFVPTKYKHLTQHDKAFFEELMQNPRSDLRHVYYGACTELVEGNYNSIANVLIDLGFQLEHCEITSLQKAIKTHEEEKAVAMRQVVEQARTTATQTWFERPYQTTAITQCCEMLKANKRVYLELATGGGKSYIVYNILVRVHTGMIVAFSPRKIVNLQNAHSKYTSILGDKCNVLNLSNVSVNEDAICMFLIKTGPKVLLACTQSAKKLWKILVRFNLTNVAIWFDEAHWGIEEWSTQRQLLEDNTRIAYRLFTSASPNRELVLQNQGTFGQLYKPISVSELIQHGWLCPIKAYVFSEPKVNADVAFFILEHFDKHERTKGFSFHHTQMSAYKMFNVHLQRYLEGTTKILPYLLVDDTFQIPEGTPLNIPYAYWSQVAFEQGDKAIAYVVAKFSMGYDFKDIDFICFSDPKVSPKDIIQSIGRGTRPDCLGELGRNKNKHLDILLPVYAIDDGLQKYERIKQVLLYLLQEMELSYNEIRFVERKKGNKNAQLFVNEEHIEIEKVQSALLELLRETNQNGMTLKKLVNILKRQEVHNIKKYHEVKDAFPELSLPDNPFVAFKDFTWLDTFGDNSPYYDKQTFIVKMKSILTDDVVEALEEIEDDEEKANYLHNVDNCFPNQSHWRFYGGEKNNYIC